MASYTVDAGKVGAYAKTLAAATVDTVTFADDVRAIEVVTDGTAAVYFTTDGSTPTVAGDGTYEIPAAGGSISRDVRTAPDDGLSVKLISAGTPTYSVARAA